MTISGFDNCADVFAGAERLHTDLMEPWSTRLGDANTAEEKITIMRDGLAATFRRRYPMPDECWPRNPAESEAVA